MRVTGSCGVAKAPVPKMPTGLVELMNDLSREVLKSNPSDIYDFCANHMQKLLEIRDGPIKSLSLEQKIARAQKKVRERVKERWSQNEREQIVDSNHSAEIQDLLKADIVGQTSPSSMQNFNLAHQKQDLTSTFEVEDIHTENHADLKDLKSTECKIITVTKQNVNDNHLKGLKGIDSESVNVTDANMFMVNDPAKPNDYDHHVEDLKAIESESIYITYTNKSIDKNPTKQNGNDHHVKDSKGIESELIDIPHANRFIDKDPTKQKDNDHHVKDLKDIESEPITHAIIFIDKDPANKNDNDHHVKDLKGIESEPINVTDANIFIDKDPAKLNDNDHHVKDLKSIESEPIDITKANIFIDKDLAKQNDNDHHLKDLKGIESKPINVTDTNIFVDKDPAKQNDNDHHLKDLKGIESEPIDITHAIVFIDKDPAQQNDNDHHVKDLKGIESEPINVTDANIFIDKDPAKLNDNDHHVKDLKSIESELIDITKANIFIDKDLAKQNDNDHHLKDLKGIESKPINVTDTNIFVDKDPAKQDNNDHIVKELKGIGSESINVNDTKVFIDKDPAQQNDSAHYVKDLKGIQSESINVTDANIFTVKDTANQNHNDHNVKDFKGIGCESINVRDTNIFIGKDPTKENVNIHHAKDLKDIESNIMNFIDPNIFIDNDSTKLQVNKYHEKENYNNGCNDLNENIKDCQNQVNIIETSRNGESFSKSTQPNNSKLEHNDTDINELTEENVSNKNRKTDAGESSRSLTYNAYDTHLPLVVPVLTPKIGSETIKDINQECTNTIKPEINNIANKVEAIEECEEETLNIPNEIDEDLSSSEIAKSEEIFGGIHLNDHNNPIIIKKKIQNNEDLLVGGNNLLKHHGNNANEFKLVDIPVENENNLRQNTDTNTETSEMTSSSVKEINEDLDTSLTSLETGNKMQKQHMDLETAAITIQKVFRNFLFKSKSSTVDEDDNIDANSLIEDVKREENILLPTKEKRTIGISRMDTVLQTVNEEKSLSLSTDDSSPLSSAATIIQAHVRGFLIRNKLNSNKTSLNSQDQSQTSLEGDVEQQKKTILNIHLVPEGHLISRDESLFTSVDLPFDNSPLSSINLHPLGYDKSEPRKQLKRGDAIQSISPPSNKSVDIEPGNTNVLKDQTIALHSKNDEVTVDGSPDSIGSPPKNIKIIKPNIVNQIDSSEKENEVIYKNDSSFEIKENISSDEMDVVVPLVRKNRSKVDGTNNHVKLMHSGEFHDVVLPTKVLRGDSSVVREFKNALVYFRLWNNA